MCVFKPLSSHPSNVDRMSSLFGACLALRVTLVKQPASALRAVACGPLACLGAPCEALHVQMWPCCLSPASHHALLTLSPGTGRGKISLLSLFPTGVKPHADIVHTVRRAHAPPRASVDAQ